MTALSSQVQLLAARRTFSSRGTFPPLPFLQEVSRLARQASCRQCPARGWPSIYSGKKSRFGGSTSENKDVSDAASAGSGPSSSRRTQRIACGKWRAFTRSHSECPGSTIDSVDLTSGSLGVSFRRSSCGPAGRSGLRKGSNGERNCKQIWQRGRETVSC